MFTPVYVTGLGAVSCLGVGVEALWAALCEGRSGLGSIRRFDVGAGPCVVGGEVTALPLASLEESGLSAGAQFVLRAASEALEGVPEQMRSSIAVALATQFGPVELFERALGPEAPEDVGQALAAGLFEREKRMVARGIGSGTMPREVSLSCGPGNMAIVYALDLIRSGRAEAVLACGYDSIQKANWAGLCASGAMALPSGDQGPVVRPFDKNRAGTIFSEGAGCLLLESDDCARGRGAPLLAEVLGGAVNNGAREGRTNRQSRFMAAAIRMALDDAGISPDEVDHANAHGSGCPTEDVAEVRAFYTAFGSRAAQIPVTSFKGAMGHAMGAAGVLEAVGCVLTLTRDRIPPTANYEAADPACLLDVVHGAPREARVETVVNNSIGFGGANAVVVLRRTDESACPVPEGSAT